MNRKSTPDIMAHLMTESTVIMTREPELQQTIKPESNKALTEKARAVSVPLDHKAIKQESNKEIKTPITQTLKEKTTFNLSQDTLESLEGAWMKLRRKLKGQARITKTLIVEKAIEMAIADLESKSELSELYNRLKANT